MLPDRTLKATHLTAPDPSALAFYRLPPHKLTNTLKDGLLSKAWKHATGELPPPKPLEIHSADSNLGGLFPPGSPLLHRYDSHWPGAPFLLVPSDRHDEHYSNKPPSMRHFRSFQMVPWLRAHPRVHIQSPPSPLASTTTPPTQSLSRGCLSSSGLPRYQLRWQQLSRLTRLPEAMF